MRTPDLLALALNHARNRRVRSWLTVTGIVIGVTAVVGLIGMGTGVEENITSQLGSFGGNTFTVTPGFNRADDEFANLDRALAGAEAARLTDADVRAVAAVPGVLRVDGLVSGRAAVGFRTESVSLTMTGVDPDLWRDMTTLEAAQGRLLRSGDRGVVVVGAAVAEETFRRPLRVNQPLEVGGVNLRVVGVLERTGAFDRSDTTLYVPADDARRILGTPPGEVSALTATADPSVDLDALAEVVEQRLLRSRGVTAAEKDFTLITSAQVQRQIEQVTGTLTAFLGAIAALALLVGGIGIANTMFMAVLERARQIGILKALGATRGDVARIFLVESAAMGLVGGVVGSLFGLGAAALVSALELSGFGPPGTPPLRIAISPGLVLGAVFFAVLVGALSGLLPALRAARLQPAETLRAE